MGIILLNPNMNHKDEYHDMMREFSEFDNDIIPGSMSLKEGEKFEDFLIRQENSSMDIGISLGRVPGTLYFIMDELSKRILGGIHIRHHLNDTLKIIGGHIGYGIRPSERKKGYATLALKLAIPKARKLGIGDIMITCDKDNIQSARIIEKNGGELESEYIHNGVMIQKWWIKK